MRETDHGIPIQPYPDGCDRRAARSAAHWRRAAAFVPRRHRPARGHRLPLTTLRKVIQRS